MSQEQSIFNIEKAKSAVKDLVDKYHRILNSGEIKEYSEEDTKKDFILPLFEVLGWDVTNKLENEVTAEKKVSKGRVDYAFRLHEIPKFFVEAKPFRENVDDRKYVDQAINYSWLKGVTWAVLTNFKKIKVFNSEIKASNPALIQFFELECQDYIKNFDKLYLLSKESLDNGLLDEKAEEWGKKLPKKPINERLFSDLTKFRELLSDNIVKNNKSKMLKVEELEEAVQRIISRLIFMRALEDKEYEEPLLLPILRENTHKHISTKLNELYRRLDDIYDAQLFARHLCEDLDIDDYPLRIVIEGLYRSEEQLQNYDFDAIDSDILGAIYEQYLGHILRMGKKGIKINGDTPHKRQQGIYYTPKYISDYIIKTIFDKIKKPNASFATVKLLDPTCGSGSFLIKAYDYFMKDLSSKNQQSSTKGDTEISYEDKVKILQNNIYGVDIDPMAVEIAQLNLFLKCVEKKHHLPILKDRIKCGNSLIDDKDVAQVRAFNWKKEFPDVLVNGGFDVIVGNPPYVHQKGEKDDPNISFAEREYYRNNYITIHSKAVKTRGGVKINTFVPYIERGLNLLKNGGYIGFIVHKNILKVESYKILRKYILDTCRIVTIVDFASEAFEEITGETVIIILQKEMNTEIRNNNLVKIVTGFKTKDDFLYGRYVTKEIKQDVFLNTSDNIFAIYVDDELTQLQNKIKSGSEPLGKVCNLVSFGLDTTDNKKYITDQKIDERYKPCLMGRNVGKYRIEEGRYVLYDKNILSRIGDEEAFNSNEKIVMQRIGSGLIAAYDDKKHYCFNSLNMILTKDKNFKLKYILGILNSKLINFYYRAVFTGFANVTVNATQGYLSEIPVKQVSEDIQLQIVSLVEKMILLNKHLEKIGDKLTNERTKIEEDIKNTDSQIDDLIYTTYGITEDDKQIVEKAIK